MRQTPRRGHGGLEALVLRCVWETDAGLSPGEVRAAIGADVAYTTVMTVLTRLWEKGLMSRTKDGRAYRYRAAVDEATLAAGRMEAALVSALDHEQVLSRFVCSLGADDVAALRRLVAEGGNPIRD